MKTRSDSEPLTIGDSLLRGKADGQLCGRNDSLGSDTVASCVVVNGLLSVVNVASGGMVLRRSIMGYKWWGQVSDENGISLLSLQCLVLFYTVKRGCFLLLVAKAKRDTMCGGANCLLKERSLLESAMTFL